MEKKGYIQVYTGSGKGKTTAAIGLAVRALGAGQHVLLFQFMKSRAYSEHQILGNLSKNLTVQTTGKPFFIAEEGMLSPEELALWEEEVVVFPKGKPPADYVELMCEAMETARRAIVGGGYDLVILDEINVALFFELIDAAALKEVLEERPASVEVVLTGRGAPDWLIEKADLVTEMKEVKHYYQQGVEARKGIEN